MINAAVPLIPDHAPFSAPQRDWLNGMLAQLFLKPPTAVPAAEVLQVDVLFASQGGTAERLAKKLAKRLREEGHAASLQSVEKLTPAALASLRNVLFLVSTYGEGDPPENARAFRDLLFAESACALSSLRYAVFALGDRNYEQFCRFGVELDERLTALGATRLQPRAEADVDVDPLFKTWSAAILLALGDSSKSVAAVATQQKPTIAVESAKPTHSREAPFHAELVERRLLTHPSSSKQTVHISFALGGGDLRYQAGDACGVLAQNDPALVGEILERLPFDAAEPVTLAKVGELTVEQALLHHLQITQLTRKAVQAFAGRTGCQTLNSLFTSAPSHLNEYLYGRGFVDMLQAYPGVLTQPAEVVELLPRLAPRLYSISSSPSAHGSELHCTVGVVRYEAYKRQRGGVASTMLADRIQVGERLPIYVQPNQRFRLPAESSQPIIMIGPGTGIAPFRGFLHERQALGHAGRNWLFFGDRSAQADFLYDGELKQFVSDGHLTRLDTAFSRDQEQKVYVQDRMLESGTEFFRWLQEGATVYVCGDASRMAKDVDAALHRIVETHGHLSMDAAQEYVSALHETNRYHRDVY